MSAAADRAKPSSVPSYHDVVDVSKYDAALEAKSKALREKFAGLLRRTSPENTDKASDVPHDDRLDVDGFVLLEVFPSPAKHFRSRCRFQMVPEDFDEGDENVGDPGPSDAPSPIDIAQKNSRGRLSYRLREDGAPAGAVCEFPMALSSINRIMPQLLDAVADDATGALARGLEACHFLAARGKGGMHITLVYSRPIGDDAQWREAASRARERLLRSPTTGKDGAEGTTERSPEERRPTDLNLLGRSKGVSVLIGEANYVVEQLRTSDGRVLTYHQPEGAFSNPNAFVAEHTVNWLADVSATTARKALSRRLKCRSRTGGSESPPSTGSGVGAEGPVRFERGIQNTTHEDFSESAPLPSLLELYCGHGTHTVALAPSFRAVAAVELSHALCEAARANLKRNGIANARVFRAPSERVARAMLRKKTVQNGERRIPETTAVLTEAKSSDSSGASNLPAAFDASDSVAGLDVDAYDVVLVDPPRAGLDPDTLRLVKKFEVVLYISCDPNSLFADATCEDGLGASHTLERFAVFDHFPYTRHVEVGAAWVRK
jgi:tRNA/tmRNA/rRNA uracil-C5-methylase (TrmA/RlmC/RlmD family)